MWLQPAPVEARMVVSEMGEQWSPNTELYEKPAYFSIKTQCVR